MTIYFCHRCDGTTYSTPTKGPKAFMSGNNRKDTMTDQTRDIIMLLNMVGLWLLVGATFGVI